MPVPCKYSIKKRGRKIKLWIPVWEGGEKVRRQTIRTFIEIKNRVARVLHTDPVYSPKRKEGGKDAKSRIESGAEKRLHGNGSSILV